MRRPIIVHVITRLIVGGAQLTTIEVCRGLADAYDLRLVTGPELGTEGSLMQLAAEATTLEVLPELRRSINPMSDVYATRALRRLLRTIDPDIVHTHSSKAGVIGRAAARGSRAKIVHTVHGWGHTPDDAPTKRRVLVAAERLMARGTDVLIAVSDDVRAEGIRQRIGRPGQYRVVPEHVSIEPVHPDFATARGEARASLGIEGDGPVVGWVGRLAPQKDPHTLVAAMTQIAAALPAARFELIGDGPMRGEVEASVAEAGLTARVRFHGLRHDARSLYCAFDLVLHPSRWEGQPRVVQEALAEGVPVVATEAAGVRQMIQDGVSGYAVALSDPQAMAKAAIDVLTDASMVAPLSRVALEQLYATSGADRAEAGHREIYRELLEQR
ncbi:MAG: glycosyltransferase family 4 protein [Solirubrobacteraceae bacterium]|nr:glycosyltransferase family 4 protein [Solirubrobacteraceae bacterium]